jgi:hypothetical protein
MANAAAAKDIELVLITGAGASRDSATATRRFRSPRDRRA